MIPAKSRQTIFIQRRKINVANPHCSLTRPHVKASLRDFQTADYGKKGRFTASRRPDQPNRLAIFDRQIDPAQNIDRTGTTGQSQMNIFKVNNPMSSFVSRLLVSMFLLAAASAAITALSSIRTTAAESDTGELIVAFGDSLTAGYGLAQDEAFPVRLQQELIHLGLSARVVNAGVSGDTTAGARARLDWTLDPVALDGTPGLVIVTLGGNDALRGIDPATSKTNLDAILQALAARNIPVLLVGMKAPPNMGEDFTRRFNGIYPALAEQHQIALHPFFLEGVAGQARLNLADGMHPNAEGVSIIAKRIAPLVARILAPSSR